MGDQLGGAIGPGVGSTIEGIFGAIGTGQQNQRLARAYGYQGQTLNDLITRELLASDTRGLEQAASRQLASASRSLDASLAQRGLFNSSFAAGQQRELAADVYSNLASEINQDQFARAAASGQLYSNPAFGFYDPRGSDAANPTPEQLAIWQVLGVSPPNNPGGTFVNQGK